MKKLLFCLSFIAAALTAAPFTWRSAPQGAETLVEVTVAENFYLDADFVSFDGAFVIEKPSPVEKEGEKIFPSGVWRWRVTAEKNFSVSYQGCQLAKEGGVPLCLLPETHTFDVTDGATPPISAGNLPPEITRAKTVKSFSGAMSKKDFLAWLNDVSAPETAATPPVNWLWLLAVLAGGFLLNLTPCVLPMIPVNLAIIGAEKGGKGALRGFAYASGMAVAYGILGAVIVLTGARFGDWSGSAVFHFCVAIIFGIFAFSTAGIVHLDLSRLAAIDARKLRGGKILAAFLLGALAALLAGTCVAPVAGAVLLTSAERYAAGESWGLFLPLLLGIGMGLPWPFAGAGLAALPKPGKVMLFVQYGFAAILLTAAIRYGISGVRLMRENVSPQAEIAKLEAALANAKKENRLVVVDFWATWCGNCQTFDREVLQDDEVKTALGNVIFVKFQAQDVRDSQTREILRRYNLPGLPGLVMLAPR